MDFEEFDEEELKKRAEDANNKKAIYGAIGTVAQGFADIPSAYELIKGKSIGGKPNLKAGFDALASNVEDPWEKQKKTYEMYKAAKENKALKDSADPSSKRANAIRGAIATRHKLDPATLSDLNEKDLISVYGDPGKLAEIQAQSEVNFNNQKALKDMDLRGDMQKLRLQKQIESEKQNYEDNREKSTTFGLARTKDDAKKLKEAAEIKSGFDANVKELISLREKYGAESLNREAVARARQLSKDLLLKKKNLESLGVLSKSDESIINAIIPDDPLEFRLSDKLTGSDSILSNLKSFQKDSDNDFNSRLQQRLTPSSYEEHAGKSGMAPARTVVKTQTNQKTGEKRVVYSDGSTEIISSVAGGR